VVDICTPTHLHPEQTRLAAAAGKHVVCEKPIARNVSDAQAMLAACDAAGVTLLIAHVLRYFPDYAHAHDQVARGVLGAVREINTLRAGYAPSKPIDNWFADLAVSGGPILDLMIHDFDFARWIGGDVTRVSARARGTLDDHAFVTLEHRSGAVSHIEGGWHLPPGSFQTRLEVIGTTGTLHASSDNGAAKDSEAPDVPRVRAAGADPYALQAQDFYATLTHGVKPRVSARDGIEALRIALAAIESARRGNPVVLS
jgi:predicted dehydrogenase